MPSPTLLDRTASLLDHPRLATVIRLGVVAVCFGVGLWAHLGLRRDVRREAERVRTARHQANRGRDGR